MSFGKMLVGIFNHGACKSLMQKQYVPCHKLQLISNRLQYDLSQKNYYKQITNINSWVDVAVMLLFMIQHKKSLRRSHNHHIVLKKYMEVQFE